MLADIPPVLRNGLLDALARIQKRLDDGAATAARRSAGRQQPAPVAKATSRAKASSEAKAPARAGSSRGKRKRGNKGQS